MPSPRVGSAHEDGVLTAFPMGKVLGRGRQRWRCGNRWIFEPLEHPSKGQVCFVLASSGTRLCSLPDVPCRSGLKHAYPLASRQTFC